MNMRTSYFLLEVPIRLYTIEIVLNRKQPFVIQNLVLGDK